MTEATSTSLPHITYNIVPARAHVVVIMCVPLILLACVFFDMKYHTAVCTKRSPNKACPLFLRTTKPELLLVITGLVDSGTAKRKVLPSLALYSQRMPESRRFAPALVINYFGVIGRSALRRMHSRKWPVCWRASRRCACWTTRRRRHSQRQSPIASAKARVSRPTRCAAAKYLATQKCHNKICPRLRLEHHRPGGASVS